MLIGNGWRSETLKVNDTLRQGRAGGIWLQRQGGNSSQSTRQRQKVCREFLSGGNRSTDLTQQSPGHEAQDGQAVGQSQKRPGAGQGMDQEHRDPPSQPVILESKLPGPLPNTLHKHSAAVPRNTCSGDAHTANLIASVSHPSICGTHTRAQSTLSLRLEHYCIKQE